MTDAIVFRLERLIRELCEDRLYGDPPDAVMRNELMEKLQSVRSQIGREDVIRLETLIARLTNTTR